MEHNTIEFKKPIYKVKSPLREHLKNYSRTGDLPISYHDLLRFDDMFPIFDNDDKETLWYSVVYREDEREEICKGLVKVYEDLFSEGDTIPYLRIDRIDFCSFGNSRPFRVRIINELNDNHDYFYIKQADASRIYGLELEEIFSPDKVNYLVDKNTLVEEHVIGIPVDEFILRKKDVKIENRLRLAKEFVRFNERCAIRLLGDMRAYNFVVEITQDFDNVQYRLRAMDFDQQSYEGRFNIYKPQFYKDNIELVKLAQELMSVETADQYRRMERVAMKKRLSTYRQRAKSLLRRMKKEHISDPDKILNLGIELNKHHQTSAFSEMTTMADLLNLHIELSLGVKILNS
jgi:hypothetical protein